MEAKTNYTVVGLVVIILAAALLSMALWLSVGFDQKPSHLYAVYMHEAVSGLSEESPVKFNGVKVGFVKAIELNHDDPQQVRVLLGIEEGTPITTTTSATLISQGITGTTFIGLSASSSDLTPLKKTAYQPYPVIPSKPSLYNQLDKVLKEVSENINTVSLRIKDLLSHQNATYLKKSLANLEEITHVLAKNSQHISETLHNTDILTRNIANTSEQFPEVMHEFKTGVHRFNLMADTVAKAGLKVSNTMDAGKVTLDKISQQTIPPAVILLRRLDTIATNLEKLSVQMRQNPSVVIRGTTPPRPGPGE